MLSGPWHITLFGGLRAEHGDQVITRFKYQKVGALFAYLAYYRKQMHSREVLVEIFWPENKPDAARNSLSTALSSLRNQFEPPGIPTGSVLRADRYSIGLNPAMITTDVTQFEAAIRESAKTNSTVERMQSLERAVGLYKGALLPGYYEEWIASEAERLSGLFFDTLRVLLLQLEEQKDISSALRYARQAVSVDPLREEAHQHLMRLLHAAGQPGAALRQYKELERRLEEETGEEPSAALRALARQIEKQSGIIASALLSPTVSPPSAAPQANVHLSSTGQPTTLTLLLTDIEGASGPSVQTRELHHTALTGLQAILREQFSTHGGQAIQETGDGFVVAFSSARKALACAVACQQALSEQTMSDEIGPLKARMALHTDDVEVMDGDYRGPALYQASRILMAAHGGQILLSQATAELVHRGLAEEIGLVDLGQYRLKDLPAPERLHQVEYPGMPQEGFPTPAAESGHQAQLPLLMTRFFGREQEIAHITNLLQNEGVRLLTLTGAGGTGKTRLAIEAADRLSAAYQGAVWFVPLADLADASGIASALLDVLRLPRSPQQEPLEQVIQALSKQPSLLILDNMEHLVEKGTNTVQTLLNRAPSLALMITSRQILGLNGEREFPVPPLPTPNGGESLEQLSLFDGVRLFVDRAQAATPRFQVSNHNAPAVAELCIRLEGIPLAIELAAARALVMTPQQMLTQVADRFTLLTSRRRDVSERQRTLHGAIEWSYRLLAPELQRFFARLSVFRGGWTVEAAEAVCEEPLALDYLAMLRDSSLVLTEETEQGMRFRMLESIREFAVERLNDSAEEVAWRKRHLAYFLNLAEETEPELDGPAQEQWLEVLETEHDNLRQALTFCQQEQGEAEAGLRLGAALQYFWAIRGHLREGRERLNAMLSLPQSQADTKARADALLGAGRLALNQGEFASAHTLFEQSLDMYEKLENRMGIAYSFTSLGQVAELTGDFSSARSLHEQSLEIFQELKYKPGIALPLMHLGVIASMQGDFASARSLCEQSLEIYRQIENRKGICDALNNLGVAAWKQGDYTTARSSFEQSVMVSRALGYKKGLASSISNLGDVVLNQGDPVSAYSLYKECLAICQELADKNGIAVSLIDLGRIARRQNDLTTARAYYEESLTISREVGNKACISAAVGNLGIVARDLGDYASARAYYEESLTISRELGTRYGIVQALEALGILNDKEKRPDRAIQLWSAAAAVREEIGAPLPPELQPAQERSFISIKEAYGEELFVREWAAGRAMSLEEAIAYALKEDSGSDLPA